MRVLVTGCGGFLGSEIVRQLIDRGDDVIGVARGDYPNLVQAGMRLTRGDLTNRDFTLSALKDVDSVIHTAAVAGVWGPWNHFYNTNTLATQHVVEACQKADVATLVFTSSPSVTFHGGHQSGVDESESYPDNYLCHYPHTKALAEQHVLSAHLSTTQNGKLHTCALRPHLIWGADDPHLLKRVLDRARAGRLRIVGDGANLIDTVHVVNAAAAHLDALDSMTQNPTRAGGKAYFIGQDEPVNCWDWIKTICEIGGAPIPTQTMSYATARSIGFVLESAYRLLGRQSEPPMTRFVAAQLAHDHYFDISAAKRDLGYRVRVSMEEGLQRLRTAWTNR